MRLDVLYKNIYHMYYILSWPQTQLDAKCLSHVSCQGPSQVPTDTKLSHSIFIVGTYDCWCPRCTMPCSTRKYITCTTCIKNLAHCHMPSVLVMCPAWAPGPTKYPLAPSYFTQFSSLGHDCWCPRCALTCSTRTYITCITCIKSLAHILS
jgi:hypothetical protein